MAKVDGFEISFTHRGSWKADLLAPGKDSEVIPVAWNTDWKNKSLLVWFKSDGEADTRLAAGHRFRVAVARKNSDGSTSSKNISGVLWVSPIEKNLDEHHPRLLCTVEARAKPSD
jgi:hypothetical protein